MNDYSNDEVKDICLRLKAAEQERDQYKEKYCEAEIDSENYRNLLEGANETIKGLKIDLDVAIKQRDGLANFNPDWDRLEAAQESLREHMQLLLDKNVELESLRAQLKAAQEQEPLCEVVQLNQDRYLSLTCIGAVKPQVGDKLYAAPIPAQQSPAAPNASMVNLLRKVWTHGFDAENYDDIDFCNEITIAQSDDSNQSPAVVVPNSWDEQAYKSACDSLEQWKSRALEAVILLERIRNDMAPTHMG